jgi:hypothetical protein
VGASAKVLEGLSKMKAAGFFLNGAVFPVVPRGHGGLRFTVTNYNSIPQIEAMLTQLNELHLEFSGETDIEIDLTDTGQPGEIPANGGSGDATPT